MLMGKEKYHFLMRDLAVLNPDRASSAVKFSLKLLLAIIAAVMFGSCSDLPCMKSFEYHNKANSARTPSEKAYYENEAMIYDQQCATYNDKELKRRQEEESRRH